MSDSLRGHAEGIADSILDAVASELEVALSQQSDGMLEDDNKDSTDETANLMVTDESGSSNDDQRTDASIENIQVDDVDSNSEIGKSTDKLDPIPDSHKKTPEIEFDHKEKSKKDAPTCDEKNIVEIEGNIKGGITPTSEEPETSSESLSGDSEAPVETDLCAKFSKLLGAPQMTSKHISELSKKLLANYLSKLQARDAENSTAANNSESDVLDQTPKEKKSSFDNNESSLRKEEAEDSSGKNESKPEETSDDRINLMIDLRNRNAGEIKSDSEPIPGCSKDPPAAEKCQEILCRRKEVHDRQPSCKLSSIIGDLNIRKSSEEKNNDPERNVSNDGSLEGGSKDTKHESKAPDLASKNPLKRNRDSQLEAPSAKYRRRCISTRSAETSEENTSRHFRFISADAKKFSVDKGTGQAGSLSSTLQELQSRKRKVDKGSKTLLKEFSFNTKRFKQNETSSSEKESSDEDSD